MRLFPLLTPSELESLKALYAGICVRLKLSGQKSEAFENMLIGVDKEIERRKCSK